MRVKILFIKLFIFILLFLSFVGIGLLSTTSKGIVKSTGNVIAKNFGGTATVILPPKQKLVSVTWKDADSMWFLYRPFKDGENAETYKYQEDSKWGVLEATITIKEQE